jgi:hypothetical protein
MADAPRPPITPPNGKHAAIVTLGLTRLCQSHSKIEAWVLKQVQDDDLVSHFVHDALIEGQHENSPRSLCQRYLISIHL